MIVLRFASSRSGTCRSVEFTRCSSMKLPNQPDRANRRQPLDFRKPVGEADVRFGGGGSSSGTFGGITGIHVMKPFTNAIARLMLVVLLCSSSGCVTQQAIRTAKGSSHTNDKGEVVVEEKPQPAAYAFLPFTVVIDIAMLPLYGIAWICIRTGIYHDP